MATKFYDKNGDLIWSFNNRAGSSFEEAVNTALYRVKEVEEKFGVRINKVKVIARNKRARFVFD